MKAEITTAVEYGSEKPCQVGRLEYIIGPRTYVTLAFRHLERGSQWRLTWHGEKDGDAAQLPEGIAPSSEMVAALNEAAGESVGLV